MQSKVLRKTKFLQIQVMKSNGVRFSIWNVTKMSYFHRFSWVIIEFKSTTAAISEWETEIVFPDDDACDMLISILKFKNRSSIIISVSGKHPVSYSYLFYQLLSIIGIIHVIQPVQ